MAVNIPATNITEGDTNKDVSIKYTCHCQASALGLAIPWWTLESVSRVQASLINWPIRNHSPVLSTTHARKIPHCITTDSFSILAQSFLGFFLTSTAVSEAVQATRTWLWRIAKNIEMSVTPKVFFEATEVLLASRRSREEFYCTCKWPQKWQPLEPSLRAWYSLVLDSCVLIFCVVCWRRGNSWPG